MDTVTKPGAHATPRNKGKPLGQKPPLKLKEIWANRRSGPIGFDCNWLMARKNSRSSTSPSTGRSHRWGYITR